MAAPNAGGPRGVALTASSLFRAGLRQIAWLCPVAGDVALRRSRRRLSLGRLIAAGASDFVLPRRTGALGITPARRLVELANEAPVLVAGLVLLRQRPGTAKGITFVTLEDETGTVNLVVHQHTWDRYYRVARRAPAWIAHGHIQTATEKYSAVIHVVVSRLEAFAGRLRELDVKARDFR